MIEPALPSDEQCRLEKLESMNLIYTPMEARYDRLTRMAQKALQVPIALVSLIGEDIQWFKSAQGLFASEIPRSISFCSHAIHGEEVFVVEDSLQDERFFDNPLVTGEPYIRFYAGAPLQIGGGSAIGTLCVLDHVPRQLMPHEIALLQDIAELITQQIQLGLQDPLPNDFITRMNEKERDEATEHLTRVWTRASALHMVQRAYRDPRYQPAPRAMLSIGIVDLEMLKREHFKEFEGILMNVSCRIRNYAGPGDVFSTNKRGSFLLFLRDPRTMTELELAKILIEEFKNTPAEMDGTVIPVSVRIGLVPLQPSSEIDQESVLAAANQALHKADAPDRLYVANTLS